MTNLVIPFAADDRVASCAARCRIIADAWLGPNSTTAVATWDDYHALVNPVLNAIGLANISAGDSGQTWANRMNALNNIETVVAGLGGVAWWSADRADLITLSGAQVTSWADVLHGYIATQSNTSAKPVYSATGFGGLPGVSADGIDDYMVCTDAALLAALPSGASPGAMLAVVGQSATVADTTDRYAFAYGGDVSSVQRGVQRTVVSAVNRGRIVVGNGTTTVVVVGSTVDFSGRHLIGSLVSATDVNLFVDDSALITTSVIPATGANRLRLFSTSNASPALFWQGVARDFVVTNNVTPSKIAYLKTFFKQRRVT